MKTGLKGMFSSFSLLKRGARRASTSALESLGAKRGTMLNPPLNTR